MQTSKPVFLKARWENLIMVNYEVDPTILLPHLPAYTELDTFDNKSLVSIVGFMFNDTRVFRLRWPYHTNFEEVNLRFYVKHFNGKTWKRGVVFVSEIVPSPIISLIANKLYHEHYSVCRMKHLTEVNKDEITVSYNWKHQNKWNTIAVKAETSLSDIKPESEEEFIFEHYWGYNKYDERTTIEYGVEHNMWQVQKVKEWKLKCDVASLYGKKFEPYLLAKPTSVFFAKGSEVVIRKPVFIKKGSTDFF
ncbi:DUF2071 domain-containing protein [Segetibacter sp.]|jgi:uncharacterized protein YqjF (DUF2071 family)|uniref:YqjF family protein n=1 Tax=Segetibacter sp. TaxID=2231182 RepID=UPI0026137DB8|nr:DUF2071 domain-containing protein [Segetibacter sp.]MCW3079368.1 hypothetical protein [Segetibacter sp.]